MMKKNIDFFTHLLEKLPLTVLVIAIGLGGRNDVGPGDRVLEVAILGVSSLGAFVDDINDIVK